MTEEIPDPPIPSYNRNHIRLVPEQGGPEQCDQQPERGTPEDPPDAVTGFLGTEPAEQMEFHFEIRFVSGLRGAELALVQARAIREVLEWFRAHTKTQPKTQRESDHRDAA